MEADRYARLKTEYNEKQVEYQLFRLYHVEKDIEKLDTDLDVKQEEIKAVEVKKEQADEVLKEKKKESGKIGRDLAKLDQEILEFETSINKKCLSKKFVKSMKMKTMYQLTSEHRSTTSYHLTTKYYKTNLLLLPLDTELDHMPAEIIESVEAFFIYFDSGNRGFSKRIGFYANFVKTHQIELGILLCDRLYDDSNEGIPYKDAKQGSNLLFDVIELERSREEEEDNPNDPLGYDEVQQALKSFVWSNIDNSSGANKNFLKTIGLASPNNAPETSSDENSVEAQLEIFENLLSQVQSFRTETASWSRDQVVDHAEKLAEGFVRMMNEGGVDDDDDDDAGKSTDISANTK